MDSNKEMTYLRRIQNSLGDAKEELSSIKNSINELPTTMESVGTAGLPAPAMSSVDSASVENGIEVTYTARVSSGITNGSEYSLFSQTKGVMVRYSSTGYPTTHTDGQLGFIDEDLFTVSEDGTITPKEKVNTIQGVSAGTTYYISLFPYSKNDVYNETLNAGSGCNNVSKCKFIGTKGDLVVSVTNDASWYASIEEITITATPTAGGQALTKTRTGAGSVTFSLIEEGQYTITFSSISGLSISSKTATVVAGESVSVSSVYIFPVTSLSSATWAQIDAIGKARQGSKYFSVGDTKNITVSGESLTFEIVGFNHDDLADGSGKAGITFGMKNLRANTRSMNSSNTNSGSYAGSAMNTYVGTTFYNGMPAEVRNVIKSVKKVTGNSTSSSSWSGTRTDNFKTWLFSEAEVFGTKTYSVGNEGSKYARFTSNSLRTKKLSNGTGSAYYWWLRSPRLGNDAYFCLVDSDGSASNYRASDSNGVCVGFCV